LTLSFPPNKVNDELRDLWSPNGNEAIWIFDSFFSHREGDLDDKLRDSFEKDGHQGELSEDSGSLPSSDSWFIKDLQIIFCCAIQPFRSRSKGSEFLVARGSMDDFGDESGMLSDGHMLNESVVIDEEGTGIGVFF
jgi:hypothetical protein